MPRLLILALPLLALWWAASTTEEGKHERGLEELVIRFDQNERKGGDARVHDAELGKLAKRSRENRAGLESLHDFASRDDGSRQVESTRVPSAFSSAKVLEKMNPALIAKLNDEERGALRSMIVALLSPSSGDQPWLCWAPGVSEARLLAYHEAERLVGLSGEGYTTLANQFLAGGRWRSTATDGFAFDSQGDSSIVTWSIVPDGSSAPGLSGQGNVGSNFRAWMATVYGGSTTAPAETQAWFGIFEDAIASMAATCGVTLVYEAQDDGADLTSANFGILGVRGDIRISARALDGNSGNLALAFGPDHGDIVFDSSDATFDNTSGSSIRLFNTVAHELGHSLGLAHVCPINRTKLLEPILTTSFQGPQFDEYQSLQRLYGDAFEKHGSFRDNDAFPRATPLELTTAASKSFPRLSIDDNSDVDFYRIEVVSGQKLSVELVPGESSYLEGEQSVSGCTQGSNFDSASVSDLMVEVLDPDGVTVLVASNTGGAGVIETITDFEFPHDGAYFIKVTGGGTDAAQLYELTLDLEERLPGPRLVLGEWAIVAESGSVKNGQLDPGETVRVRIGFINNGELASGALTAQVSGSNNVVIYSQAVTGNVAAGGTGVLEVVFGAAGDCGDLALINVALANASGPLVNGTQEFELGDLTITEIFNETLEGSSNLPGGWTSVQSGTGLAWVSVSTDSASGVRSAFSPGRSGVGEASLLSPSFVLASDGGTLSFQHLFQLESGFDGGVLEVSRNQGPWLDLIEDPVVTVSGGYNRTIRENFGSAIAGRRAWSGAGTNQVFITTTAELPASWGGETIRFRWRVVHDMSTLREGWWIDNLVMAGLEKDCEVHRPAISLSLARGSLDENFPTRPAVLILESELPLLEPLAISLVAGGSAGPGDYQGELALVFPAGQSSMEVPLLALPDGADENEILTVEVPVGMSGFVPGAQSMVTLEIRDRIDRHEWSGAFFGGPIDFAADADGDGFTELAEYLLGTDPTSPASRPDLVLHPSGNAFLIPLGFLPERSDATLGGESSGDLKSWNPLSFVLNEQGMMVSLPVGQRFLRLTFSLNP